MKLLLSLLNLFFVVRFPKAQGSLSLLAVSNDSSYVTLSLQGAWKLSTSLQPHRLTSPSLAVYHGEGKVRELCKKKLDERRLENPSAEGW